MTMLYCLTALGAFRLACRVMAHLIIDRFKEYNFSKLCMKIQFVVTGNDYGPWGRVSL
jgi:hypothetical protein